MSCKCPVNAERKELKKFIENRRTFTGTFVRTGWKNGWNEPLQTVLLENICDINGKVLCDHLWFNYTKGFEKLEPLFMGDVIQFDARTKCYLKGYFGYREDVNKPPMKDFKLSFPTKLKKLSSLVRGQK